MNTTKEQNMTVNRDRKMIAVEHAKIYLDDYDTLDEVLTRLQQYREEIAGDAYFETRVYSYSDDTYLALMTTRPETDAEMAQRIEIEKYGAAKTEDAERKEFERLAKKFGKA